MNGVQKNIEELNIEKLLNVIFIVISVLNIYGINIQQLFLKTNNRKYESEARNTFILTIIIATLVYIYFVYRNYEDLKVALSKNNNVFASQVRLFGSILVIIGALCFLYYQSVATTPIGVPND